MTEGVHSNNRYVAAAYVEISALTLRDRNGMIDISAQRSISALRSRII